MYFSSFRRQHITNLTSNGPEFYLPLRITRRITQREWCLSKLFVRKTLSVLVWHLTRINVVSSDKSLFWYYDWKKKKSNGLFRSNARESVYFLFNLAKWLYTYIYQTAIIVW